MSFGIGKNFEKNLGKELGDSNLPPADNNLPPADNNLPPADNNLPPADNNLPPADNNLPPADNNLPPADNNLPPADNNNPPAPSPVDNNSVLAFLNLQNKTEYKSIEEYNASFTKEVDKEIIKNVNPWAEQMTPEDETYFKYKKETGRGRKDFDFMNQDLSKKSSLDLARERVRQDSGLPLTNKEADEFLEEKLVIDLSEDKLSTTDNIKLNGYVKPYKEQIVKDQETYKTPLENLPPANGANALEGMVKLEDGGYMPQEKYDNLTNDRNAYITETTNGVNSVTSEDFQIEVDDNGDKRTIAFKYEYSKEDKHSMLSDALDVDATVAKRYRNGDSFNHQGLAEGMWWGVQGNRQKVISAAMQQARAEAIQEVMANVNNENFTRQPIHRQPTDNDGYGTLTGNDNSKNGFGVKYPGFAKTQ